MKIFCKELDKHFHNKEDLFKSLVENEGLIIDAKKSEIYFSHEKALQLLTDQNQIEKAFQSTEKAIKFDSDYYYFVVNSANYLDSHKDVHLDGNWNRTVKSQQGKVYLIWHHDFTKSENIVFFPEDIEIFTAKIEWKLLGKEYEGSTYCLVYKCLKEKIQNQTIKGWIDTKKKLQLSVRMQYVNVDMAFKSDNPDYSKYNKAYEEIYPLIINKDEFEEIDYFYGVKEAKNVMESSLLPYGSNSATAEISNQNKVEPLENTQQQPDSSKDTQNEQLKELLSNIKF